MTIIRAIFNGEKPSSVKVTLCDGTEHILNDDFIFESPLESIYITQADEVENYNHEIKGTVVEYTLITEAEKIKAKVEELKAELASSDYKAIKYAEGWISDEEYAPIKARRQTLRDEINKYEN